MLQQRRLEMRELGNEVALTGFEILQITGLTRAVDDDSRAQPARCAMHALVLIEHAQGGGFVDLVETLALGADPLAEPATAMSVMRKNVIPGRGPQHRASQHAAGPVEMVLDGGVELDNEFFDLSSKDGHVGNQALSLTHGAADRVASTEKFAATAWRNTIAAG